MNTKKLALTIVFAAITIALNPTLTHLAIPAPFDPGLFYQIWEIPIIIALLIISPISSIAICLLNTSVLLLLFPGALPTGPLYNMLACLSMQIGIYTTISLGKKIHTHKKPQTNILNSNKLLATATGIGIFTRTTFMTIIHYFALPQPPPIGFGLNQVLTSAFLPLSALFNTTLALYTIPIAWIIARQVQKMLQLTTISKKQQNNLKNNQNSASLPLT